MFYAGFPKGTELGWALLCLSCSGQTNTDRTFIKKIKFLRSFE